jgi:hypothetical protein
MRSVPSRHPTPGWGADMHRDHLESVIFGLPNPQLSEVVHERYARLYLEKLSQVRCRLTIVRRWRVSARTARPRRNYLAGGRTEHASFHSDGQVEKFV